MVTIALCAAVAMVVGGCGSSDDQSTSNAGGGSKTRTLRVATVAGVGSLPLRVAYEQGFFRKRGLNLKFTEGADIQTWVAGLGKAYDVSLVTPPILFAAAAKGVPINVISGVSVNTLQRPNQVLFTQKAISSYADLQGKKVGVPTLTGSSAQGVLYLVKHDGGDPAKVKLVQLQYPMEPIFEAGRVDAMVSQLPFWKTLKPGDGVQGEDVTAAAVKAASGGKVDTAVGGMYAASAEFAKSNPDVVKAWHDAMAEAVEYIRQNEAGARQILQSWLHLPAAVAKTTPLVGFDANVTASQLTPLMNISQDLGLLPKPPDATSLLAPSLR